MASEFAHEVIEALKPEALGRVKAGAWGRIFGSGYAAVRGPDGRRHAIVLPEDERGQRFTRASYITAVGEVAEEFTPEQREAWRAFGTLPEGFWKDVERRAAEWDSLH